MSEHRPPQEIADIVDAVVNRDPDMSVMSAVDEILHAGYYFVGTAQSEAVHQPVAGQHYKDMNLDHDVYVEDPEIPVLQVTWSGKIAIMGATFGDINKPDQRRHLGVPLTAEAHVFGWYGYSASTLQKMLNLPDGDPGYFERAIRLQAETELLSAVRRLNDSLQGSIDIISREGDFYWHGEKIEPESGFAETRPGIFLTQQEQRTVATLPVFGSALWETDVVPIKKS